MIRLALRVGRADAELVLAELLELAPGGVEEIELPADGGGEGDVEYAVYGAPGELPELPDLQAAAGDALVEISTSEIPDDWSERWKAFHRPVLIAAPLADPQGSINRLEAGQDRPVAGHGVGVGGDHGVGGEVGVGGGVGGEGGGVSPFGEGAARACTRARVPSLYVRPPWEAPNDRQEVSEVVIDPAQAFGTGAHPTTRLCLELLLDLATVDAERGSVLDVGAGSGVLAIAAAKLGYGPIFALDNERESVTAILDNAAVNRVELEARHFDLRREALPEIDGMPATVLLANLLRPLLYDLSEILSSPPRHLIASGLLCAEADGVASAFASRHNLGERRRLERGEWSALWLTRD